MSPRGVNPNPSSYRISTVCYPPVNMMDGLHRVALASQPHGELVVLPPEYISPM